MADNACDRVCNICGSNAFLGIGRRVDGHTVLRCSHCGMGVLDEIPEDLHSFYSDDYYDAPGRMGYSDYTFMAEHGVGWAAALIRCLKPSGRVLDVGCVNGNLLRRLGDGYECFGIEANEAMAARAAKGGIGIIAHDLFERDVRRVHAADFDAVTSIAVFEHLCDFRGGFEICLALLKQDGVLVFEVPLLSETHENTVWFSSSLEHVFYPTLSGIRYLVEKELGLRLIGGEIFVRDYASTFIGIVAKDPKVAKAAAALYWRLTSDGSQPLDDTEREARLQLRLVHAAKSSEELIADLRVLPPTAFTRPLLQRLQQVWTTDIRGRTSTQAALQQATALYDKGQGELAHLSARLLRSEAETLLKAAELERAQAQIILAEAAKIQAVEIERHRLAATEKELAAARIVAGEHAALERSLALAQDELARQRRRIVVLEADLSAADQDRQVNVARMIAGMAAAEEGGRIAMERATALETERDEFQLQLQAVLNSNIWRASLPLRHIAGRHPRLARPLRSALKIARKAVGPRAQRTPAALPRGEDPASQALVRVPSPPTPISVSEATQPAGMLENSAPWPADRPLVTVVIPCFNYGHFVHEAIESALMQTLSDIEVIVVEGGSTSLDSRLRLGELAYPQVRVVLQDRAHRAGANRNFGIRQARGKYICCLDADDRLDPTYLEKAAFLLEHYEYDVVSTALRFFGNRSDTCNVIERPVLADLLESNHVLTCAVFRKELWERAGGIHDFGESEGHIHEDWGFWMRLAALGARFINLNGEYLFHYRSHGVSLSSKNVVPTSRQAEIIRRFNEDVLGPDAIERSAAVAAENRRASEPLRNLVRSDWRAGDTPRAVLIAMPFLVLGGAERLMSGIVRHLARAGWRVIIITTIAAGAEHGDTTDWFAEATREIYHLPKFLAPDRWADFIRYLIEAKRVGLLWMVGSIFVYDLIPELTTAYPGLRVVDLLFNTVGHTANNRRHAREIDLTIVENEEVRSWLLEHGESDARIRLIKSGVDLDLHSPRGKSSEVLAHLGIGEDAFLVGFSGRWSEEKDPLGFVEIASRVRAPKVAFLMTGTGPLRPQIEAAAAALSPKRFHLVGSVPDVLPYLASCDILCLPSSLDGRPVVVMEALAVGVPVLASRVGALPELVEDGVSGFLVAPGDYDGFARLIDDLAVRPAKLQAMKREARLSAERELDMRRMLDAYEAALDTALAGRGSVQSA